MENTQNVLVTGIGQANYILQLYKEINPALAQFNFNCLNLKQFGKEKIESKTLSIFDRNYFYSFNFKNVFQLGRCFVVVLNMSYLWKDFRFLFAEKGWKSFGAIKSLILRHIESFGYAEFIDKHTDTDIIHLHVPRHRYTLFLKYLKKNYQVIISYWGSDIFRIDNLLDHSIQDSTLGTARFITTTTPEMEFAVLSRYGFHLSSRMRRARFIHDDTYYKIVDDLTVIETNKWKQEYKKSLNIDNNKIIILFGHNAHRENNHLEFLKTLQDLPQHVVSKYHIIFPLTYGANEKNYISHMESTAATVSTSFTFLREFLNWRDLAKLKIISDVYIHCPTTDGLSAFLTEFFYTNNLAIVGGWLPYNTFRNYGINYTTVNDFKELKEVILDLKGLVNKTLKVRAKNRNIIRENFEIKKITNEWVNIFCELESSDSGEK